MYKIIVENDNEVQNVLYVHVTLEPKMTILYYGESGQVTSPKVLKEEMTEIIKDADSLLIKFT